MFNELVLIDHVFSKLVVSRVGVLLCLLKLADHSSMLQVRKSDKSDESVCIVLVRQLLVLWGLRFTDDPKEIDDFDITKLTKELSSRFQGLTTGKESESNGSNFTADANIRDSIQLMTAKLIGVFFS